MAFTDGSREAAQLRLLKALGLIPQDATMPTSDSATGHKATPASHSTTGPRASGTRSAAVFAAWVPKRDGEAWWRGAWCKDFIGASAGLRAAMSVVTGPKERDKYASSVTREHFGHLSSVSGQPVDRWGGPGAPGHDRIEDLFKWADREGARYLYLYRHDIQDWEVWYYEDVRYYEDDGGFTYQSRIIGGETEGRVDDTTSGRIFTLPVSSAAESRPDTMSVPYPPEGIEGAVAWLLNVLGAALGTVRRDRGGDRGQ